MDLAREAGVHVQTVKYWEGRSGSIRGVALEWLFEAFERNGVDLEGIAPIYVPTPKTSSDEALMDSMYIEVDETEASIGQMARPVRDLCGAKTRKGQPCAMKPVPGKRRCKFHGGFSTGPKTKEGRERIAKAQRRRWSKQREEV